MKKIQKNDKSKAANRYFTSRKLNTEAPRDILAETSPYEVPPLPKILAYKEYSEVIEEEARHKMVNKPVYGKSNLRMKMMSDFNERMYISQLPDEVQTVVDFYPDFYNVIEGRPLRTSDEIKVYLNNLRNCAMIRQQIGYRRDMILQLGQNINDENKRYNLIKEEYEQHVSNFKQFIEDDHIFAVDKVHAAELVRTMLNAKTLEYFPLVTRLNILYGRIFELEDIRKTLKKYRKFLFQVSPVSWRNIYDHRYRKTKIWFELEQESFSYQVSFDIDVIAERVLEELKYSKHLPYLYFKEPIELIRHFEHIELQCKKYILHLISLASPVDVINTLRMDYSRVIKMEEDHLFEFVKVINEKINFMEECTKTLQNLFFVFLHKIFFKTVASTKYLKLRVCVQYIFKEIFGQAELIRNSLIVPVKLIELTYEEMSLKLDLMDLKIVNTAQKECYLEDLKVMNDAYRASRKLKEFRELEASLKKAFSPPARFQRWKVGKFIKKKPKIKNTIVTGVDNLTEAQREKLLLFTTWCEVDDPSPYLKQLKRQSFNLANG